MVGPNSKRKLDVEAMDNTLLVISNVLAIGMASVIPTIIVVATVRWTYKRITWNKNAKTRGWRVIPGFFAPPFGLQVNTLELWFSGSRMWCGGDRVHPIRKVKLHGSALRFRSGCFFGDLAMLYTRLYGVFRPSHEIAYRLLELEKLGIDVSSWPKTYRDYRNNPDVF